MNIPTITLNINGNNIDILPLIIGYIFGILTKVLLSYFKQKAIKIVEKGYIGELTKIQETIKLMMSQELESFKKYLDTKILEVTIHKDIFLKSYDYSIRKVIELDEMLSKCFWLYIDYCDKKEQNPHDMNIKEELLNLRRLTFNSMSYIDPEILFKVQSLSIKFDKLDSENNIDISNDFEDIKILINSKYMLTSGEKLKQFINEIKNDFSNFKRK